MSALKIFNRILGGPLFVPQNYGDYVGILAYGLLNANPDLNIFHLTLGCMVLYPFLMYYNLATASVVTNPVLEDPSDTLTDEVSKIAKEENVSLALLKIVSNFAAPTMICGRFVSNAELFISTHFLEEKNTSMREFFLRLSFKRLKAQTKLMIIYTALASLTTPLVLLAIKLSIIYLAHTVILRLSVMFFMTYSLITASKFYKAYINRKLTFALDKQIAQQFGTKTVIAALQDFNTQTNFDNNLHNYPEWALPFPKTSSRVAALLNQESLKAS